MSLSAFVIGILFNIAAYMSMTRGASRFVIVGLGAIGGGFIGLSLARLILQKLDEIAR